MPRIITADDYEGALNATREILLMFVGMEGGYSGFWPRGRFRP